MPRVDIKVVKSTDGKGLERVLVAKRRKVGKVVDVGALMIQGEAQKLILRGPKSGRIYKLRGDKEHQASAPGEPPASNTGNLAGSIQPDHKVDSANVKETRVVARAGYALFLEEGTARMAERPFMSRAFKKLRRKILKLIRKAAAS